jgi:hypothetical protein
MDLLLTGTDPDATHIGRCCTMRDPILVVAENRGILYWQVPEPDGQMDLLLPELKWRKKENSCITSHKSLVSDNSCVNPGVVAC